MKFIKEYHQQSKTVLVRSNSYNKSLSHVLNMVSELWEDFGKDGVDDPRVVLYAGDRYAKTLGVEAKLLLDPEKSYLLSQYQEVRELELYYG